MAKKKKESFSDGVFSEITQNEEKEKVNMY
jgi:hypothetical protein